jgi:20S proteasome alpha/beta subunit
MSTADAIDLGRRAIVHAAHRDAASGNIVRSKSHTFSFNESHHCIHLVYHMKETGWEKIEEKDTNDYMYQYREDKTMNF